MENKIRKFNDYYSKECEIVELESSICELPIERDLLLNLFKILIEIDQKLKSNENN